MKYISLFSGIGGFELGIQNSNINMECVGFAEIDKYATSIYLRHFPRHKNFGDVTKIKTEDLPDFDFLVGGFPCQAFSHAGKRRGFDDTRGTLFFEIARILKDKRPKYFLLENVKGLLSHDKGKTFQTILEILNELRYGVSWRIYNSKNYGVPQNRERVFIKGYLRGKCGREILHQTRNSIENPGKLNTYRDKKRSYSKTVARPVLTPDRVNKRQNGRRMKEDGEPSFTLTATDRHGVYDGYRIRRLTPVEWERLQAFPDDWTLLGKDGETISDTQRYKCCGNAVTTSVITCIINEMFGDLD